MTEIPPPLLGAVPGPDWECRVGTCPLCGRASRVMVPTAGLLRYRAGDFVQVAFPMLTPGERETVLSGCHEECWDQVMAEPDTDEAEGAWAEELDDEEESVTWVDSMGDEPR